jgi:hypothetical protein
MGGESGWNKRRSAHGVVTPWPGVPEGALTEVQAALDKLIERVGGVQVEIKVWPINADETAWMGRVGAAFREVHAAHARAQGEKP